VKHLKRIIIDASYIDQKKRGILDMKETEIPLVKMLMRDNLVERYADEDVPTRLLFF
jgi:protein CMS1